MKKLVCSFRLFPIGRGLLGLAALLCATSLGSAAPVTLLRDSFNGTGTPASGNLNYNLSGRQSGALGLIPYTGVGNVQVGNGGEPHDGGNVLLCAFAANAAALNYNFNNARSAGGLTISFDLDPNAHNNADASNWGAVVLGASEANRTTFINGATPHFGILFRANGLIQAFDGGSVVTPVEPNWAASGNYSLQFHHFDIVVTGPGDGNPFDGAGDTQIDVYVDGGAVPVYSFTKVGGYADNYVNFQSSDIADFDNLVITAINPPSPPSDPWQQVAWAGDLDSGIDASYTYTHAYNFGSANSPIINGVTFTGVNGGNPSVGGSFSVTGIPNNFGDDGGANITGNSITLARSFIYGGNPGTLTLQGLVPGRQYLLTLYSKAWDQSGNRIVKFSAGSDQRVIDQDSYGRNDASRNGLRITYAYTANGSGTLTVTLTPEIGANTFHFYGFSNREGTPTSSAWQYSEWTSDASSGVSTAYYYTHAYNLGSGNNVIINNLTFAGQGAQNPSVPGVFSLANFFGFFPGGYTPEITGAGFDLARQFIYDGRPGTLTLNGLVPGRRYVLSLYSASFGPPGRLINFLANGDLQTIDQDAHSGARGIVVSFPYTADVGGSVTVRMVTVNPGWSFHLCGFANREESLATTPRILTQPADATVALGETASFSFVVAAAAPVTYQWYLGVDAIPGATSPTLQVLADFPDVAGGYRVSASNNFGSITSRVAMLTVRLPVPGLFDTGVDNNRNALPDGSTDPHYALIVNPDSASPNAIVEDSTAFPIVTGPWVANTATSKWIGPRLNTAAAAGLAVGNGTYVYRTTFDLTGLDLATIVITGTWATDNAGLNIRINGVDAGITSPDFLAFYPFTINAGNATFINGVNTLDFVVQNSDAAAGYTGLRVANLRGTASLPSTPPAITVQPQGFTAGTGENIGFTVSATGSSPLTYQWTHAGTNLAGPNNPLLLINNVDHSHAGTYTVTVSNPFGSATSSNAVLVVRDSIPGFYNTGVDDSRAALADGMTDPHYSLLVNPDSASPGAIVEDSTLFPIVAGPWVPNDAASKWIGPRLDTTSAAGGDSPGGDYTYRFTVDLTGFESSTIEVLGEWATDNLGLDILVNGLSTGQGNAGQFATYTAFHLTNGFTAGPNTIDFKLNNAASGWTGLRVRNLRGLGTLLPPGTMPFIASQPQDVVAYFNQTAMFRVIANGSTPLSYQWYFEGFPIPGGNSPSLSVFVDFPDVAGHYKVEVSNGAGMVTSREAILAINTPPTVPTKGGATSQDTPMSISSAKLLLGVTDPDGDAFALDSVASTSASGGAIAPAGTGLFTYAPPAGFTGMDTFAFNVRDSRGGIGVGMVEVLVVSGALPTQNQVLMMTTPNGVLVRFAGIPGRNYQVQRSTDLNNWTTLATLPAPPHGIIEYNDPMVLPAAFYRTASAP
jgi:hypothetical protein